MNEQATKYKEEPVDCDNEKKRQIESLDALIGERRNVYPITMREVVAIGPFAVQEWARRLVARALKLMPPTAVEEVPTSSVPSNIWQQTFDGLREATESGVL